MSSVWDERAEAYRTSEAHREGEDLDLLVEWARGAKTALDVATGGGHVARRLREAGLDVVSLDPALGMEPDVVAPAEKLPFDDSSFDVVACRVAAHHFEDVRAAVREMARVARDLVLVSDNLFVDEDGEEADRVRDPSHVRNYSEDEWRSFFAAAGLDLEEAHAYVHPVLLEPWLERAGCAGADAERVRELVAARLDGDRVRLERICLKGRKRGEG
ncbi:MAG TPA: class I SAM-dependent methyltransferase [Gaiellaceae bacterium]|jgi:SAM-dependent methyltransferase|nr:class I SAM-dependent methyltransferase [Gaiellaceae bacterium]